MIGSSLASQLPQKPGTAREDAILSLIKSGNAIVRWVPLVVDMGGVRATFQVTAEPLMLGAQPSDGFYPGVTASTLQRIADYYDATLLTPKLVDEIWKQAQVRVDPFVGMAGTAADVQRMSDTSTFVRHTDAIRKRVPNGIGSGKLVANIGKYWVVSAWTSRRQGLKSNPNVPASENYGFFASSPGSVRSVTRIPGVNVIQTPGHAHDYNHSDYSQVVMMVRRDVVLCEPSAISGFDGCSPGSSCSAPGGPGRTRCVDIYDLANDQELAKIVSHEGTINMRLPGVAYVGSRVPPAAGPVGRGGGGAVTPPGSSVPVASPPKAPSGSSPPVPAYSEGVPRRTTKGEKGAAVVAWQQYLISQGYDLSPHGADGDHGNKTEQASLQWEKSRTTPRQVAAKEKPMTTQAGVPRRTTKGEKGAAVVAWQQYLISQGYDLSPYGADGDHGNKTEQASLQWEKSPGKASPAATASVSSRGGIDKGFALVVAAAGLSVGWLLWDVMEKK